MFSSYSPKARIRRSAIFAAARQVCQRLQQAGFEAFFVGGCVRDFLYYPQDIPHDIDMATSASVEAIQRLFRQASFVGESFGVCHVRWRAFAFDVATFRIDGTYADRRHPQSVSIGTRQQDSQRRDFTVNALYYDPCRRLIYDPHGGQADLQAKVLRCVGQADERFQEDALRIVRAWRFAADFGFALHPQTQEALCRHVPLLAGLARERVLMEFRKARRLGPCLVLLYRHGGLGILFPQWTQVQPGGSFPAGVPSAAGLRLPVGVAKAFPFFSVLWLLSKQRRVALPTDVLATQAILGSWPLEKSDRALCQDYLSLLQLCAPAAPEVRSLSFLLFRALHRTATRSLAVSRLLCRHLQRHPHCKSLKPQLRKLAKSLPCLPCPSEPILEALRGYQIPERYWQWCLDYARYKRFLGLGEVLLMEELEFVLQCAAR